MGKRLQALGGGVLILDDRTSLVETRMKTASTFVALFSTCLLLGLPVRTSAADPAAGKKTALDDYIGKPDPTFSWKVVKTIPGDGVTTFIVDLKSQTWRTTPEVNRTLWEHWLVIVKPELVKHDTAYL